MADPSAIVALGKVLQQLGYDVAEQSQFGGVDPDVHTPTSWHYKDLALDVNKDDGSEREWIERLYAALDANRGPLKIVELLDEGDHLHVAADGAADRAAIDKFLEDYGAKNIETGGIVDAITPGIGKPTADAVAGAAGAVGGAALDLAKGVVSTVFDALGIDGARIVLYVVLVAGSVAAIGLGIMRLTGASGAPEAAPA